MKARPHTHPCQSCGAETPCDGEWERNIDGFPEVICQVFHWPGGTINEWFRCDDCIENSKRPTDHRNSARGH